MLHELRLMVSIIRNGDQRRYCSTLRFTGEVVLLFQTVFQEINSDVLQTKTAGSSLHMSSAAVSCDGAAEPVLLGIFRDKNISISTMGRSREQTVHSFIYPSCHPFTPPWTIGCCCCVYVLCLWVFPPRPQCAVDSGSPFALIKFNRPVSVPQDPQRMG